MSQHVDLSATGIERTLALAQEHAERAALGELSMDVARSYALTSIALSLTAIGRHLWRNDGGLGS